MRTDEDTTNVDTSKLVPFSDVGEKSLEMSDMKMLCGRVEKLLLMLQHVLGTAMPFEVNFPVLRLVKVFCELSNLLHVDLNDNNNNNNNNSVMVVKTTGALLKCISASVKQLKSLLLPFSQQLGKILTSPALLRDVTNKPLLYQCFFDMFDQWLSLIHI